MKNSHFPLFCYQCLALDTFRIHLNESDIEFLALPVLLQPVCKVEGVVQFKALEYIESATQNDLPAMVRCDVTVMFCT
jgi:hypothetical protein